MSKQNENEVKSQESSSIQEKEVSVASSSGNSPQKKQTQEKQEQQNQQEKQEEQKQKKEAQEEADDYYAVFPPNGGWGWIVVICAFYCNVVVDGIQLTFGVFLKSLAETFHAEYSEIALAGSLMFGVHLLMGPICAGVSSVFGLRPVTIAGALICCIGVGVTYFATGCWFLYLSYGIVGGMGLGLIYMNSLVITGVYFTTLLPIAVAIVVSGTGVGTMVFAGLGNFLLRVSDWRNSFLMQAALAGSMGIAAIAFKPLKPIKVKLTPVKAEETQSIESLSSLKKGALFIPRELSFQRSTMSIRTFHSAVWNIAEQQILTDVTRPKHCSCSCCKSKQRKKQEEKTLVLAEVDTIAEEYHLRRKSYVEKERTWSSDSEVENVSLRTNSSNHKQIFTRIDFEEPSIKKTNPCEPLKRTIVAMLDCHLLGSFSFFIFTISGALQITALLIVYIYEKDRCAELGFSEELSGYFVIFLGGANTIWRIILGSLAIIPKINYKALAISGTVIGGVATMFSGFSSNVYYQFGFCVFFGLGMASFAVFRLVMLVELVGAELISNATGINLLFMGVFCIIAPPLFGWAMEMTESYNIIFLITGILITSSGFMLIGLHKLK